MTASEKWQAVWPPDTHTTEYAQKRIIHRKYDEETLFDVESGDLIGRRLLDSDLPDDNATAELIKRGYYRR